MCIRYQDKVTTATAAGPCCFFRWCSRQPPIPFFFLSEHSLLLVRNRKTVTEPEPGKLESSGRTPGHLLYRLETDLTFQPLGSTLAPPGLQQLPQGSRVCREHTKWKRRAQEHSREFLSQSSSTFNPISPPKRSTIHSTMSAFGIHFVLHPLAGKGLGMVAGLSDNQETSCPSRGRKSGEYQKSPA